VPLAGGRSHVRARHVAGIVNRLGHTGGESANQCGGSELPLNATAGPAVVA
jgi:hypothetical protein